MANATKIHITDVGMRDGFQMEKTVLSTETKIEIGLGLIAAGVPRIEATSFVSPRAVPQMADASDVISALKGRGAQLTALVPNARGAERALAAGVDELVIFASASQTHNQLNVNRTVEQSLMGISEIAQNIKGSDAVLCGAVATSFGCPFEGNVSVEAVAHVVEAYVAAGARHITLGDTTGMATPPLIERLCAFLTARFPGIIITLHFHNTRGLGLLNVQAGLDAGIVHFESSLGGLGGCPFATGATGNICTEDLVYMMDEIGIYTGIDLEALIKVALRLETILGRTLPGQVMKAGPRLKLHPKEEMGAAIG